MEKFKIKEELKQYFSSDYYKMYLPESEWLSGFGVTKNALEPVCKVSVTGLSSKASGFKLKSYEKRNGVLFFEVNICNIDIYIFSQINHKEISDKLAKIVEECV